ncbi:MAG TPA: 2-C-methyl-D-erythritol 2,4-cyclodiphosphate synthase [Acidimicrobiia bacterium]
MTGRVGLGFDVHPFGGDGPLVLGGVVVDGPGLAGHSDADVIVHAVADALLGAAGLPDLGTIFPADDERYRDASSIALLRAVAEAVAGEGWRVANVDVVVAAEQPRLAPHLAEMAAVVREALAPVRPDAVAVKPKHPEGLGAIGRAEGIAAWAVALLVTVDEP